MRKYDFEKKKVLDKLTNASPNEVGKILKEYFELRKKDKK